MAASARPDRGVALPAPGEYMCGLTWAEGLLWHSDQGALQIYAIDPADGRVVTRFRCAWVRADLAFDGAVLCQIGGRPKRLVLVDRETGAVTGKLPVLPSNGRVTGAELGPEGMWMCLRNPMVVQLRDYPGLRVLREHPVPGASPSGLTYARGMVVYGEFEPGALHAIDAATGEHAGSVSLPGRPTGITWDGERLWYCDFPHRVLRTFELDDLV